LGKAAKKLMANLKFAEPVNNENVSFVYLVLRKRFEKRFNLSERGL
jgi:hypothetical protein